MTIEFENAQRSQHTHRHTPLPDARKLGALRDQRALSVKNGIRATAFALCTIGSLGMALTSTAIAASDAFRSGPRTESDEPDYSGAISLPTKQLASRLLTRVGQTFVADTRYGSKPFDTVGFFTQPKPFGEALCRVDRIDVPRKVVRGHSETREEFWDDDISIQRMYAVWKVPGSPRGLTRDRACLQYHDFGRLIDSEDGTAVERVIGIITHAAAKAKSRNMDFALTCADDRQSGHPVTCDGADILSRIDVKEFFQVTQVETAKAASSERHIDEVFMRKDGPSGCGKSEIIKIEVTSTQHYGLQAIDDGELQTINITRLAFC